mmetsp:Transcript_2694/g.7401  ORF Transcript_2694/g.7401 Transcript_2694/m.7401 type:complete len:286 (-) Transcript_2694:271-1128(-)
MPSLSALSASMTSTSSPTASFLIVLLSFTSKAVVMAMSFTHLLNSWSISSSVSLVTPPAYPSSPRSSCAALKPWSGMPLTNLRNSSSGTSWPPLDNSAKTSSGFLPAFRMCSCMAPATAAWASLAACFLARCSPSCCALHLLSRAPTLTFSLISVARASLSGPSVAALISSMPALILTPAASTPWRAASRTLSTLAIAAMGFSSSLPRVSSRAFAADTASSTVSWHDDTICSASQVSAAAALLSAASLRRLRSASMHSACFLSACATLFLSSSCSAFTLLTRGLI